jgi:hypothetical protein
MKMKKLLLLISLLFFVDFVFCQTKKSEIMFILNDSVIQLKNDFDIYLVVVDSSSKLIMKPQIENNSFYLNNTIDYFKGYKYYVFSYKEKYYNMNVPFLYHDQDMKIEFIYDENKNQSEATFTISYMPLEFGDGVYGVVRITDIDNFFRMSELIIDINHHPLIKN